MTAELTTFFQQRWDGYDALAQQARDDFSAWSDAIKSALLVYDAAVTTGSDLDRQISAKRLNMSAASNMPADVELLAEELRQLLIRRRHSTATIAGAAEILSFAKAELEVAQSSLNAYSQMLAVAETKLAAASKEEAYHGGWISTETEDAISAVRDLAIDLLAENPIAVEEGEINPADVLAAAAARIEGDIPDVLRARARDRAALALSRIAAFHNLDESIGDDVLNHGTSSKGSSGLLVQRRAEYETAENAFKQYALTSVSRYQLALSLLTSVADSRELTVAESDRISALTLAVDADEITTETALHLVLVAVDAKKLDVDLAIVAALVADIDADPLANAAVIATKGALTGLEADLVTAKTAHTQEFADALDSWEGAVPDAIWANLQAFDSAMAMLTAISTSDATPLTTDLINAKNALVSAADDDDDNRKLELALSAAASIAKRKTQHVTSVQQSVGLSAMRGDY